MKIKSLQIVNFKSHTDLDLTFTEKLICFSGENGIGKTNLLDAIHYLCMAKSFLNNIDSQNIHFDNEFFMINGIIEKNEKFESIKCSLKRKAKKKLQRNNKEYEKIADHIGLFPTVVISPYDSNLITEGSETRRKFLDSIISQYDKQYLFNLIEYNKALKQRNFLLKKFKEDRTFDAELLEIWTLPLIDLCEKINKKRVLFVNEFNELFNSFYADISNKKEVSTLTLKTNIEGDLDLLYSQNIEKDRILTYTNIGIHKDDLEFLIDGKNIKKYGSQGQQKSYLIALKLAKYFFLKEKTNTKPILLLDDIFDKLDEKRVSNLLELAMSDDIGQIFITHTENKRLEDVLNQKNFPFQMYKL